MPISNSMYEPITMPGWIVDFSDAFNEMQERMQERQKFDKVWQEIKEKNNW